MLSNLKLKYRILAMWFGSIVFTLLSVGFIFTFLVTDLKESTSQDRILKSFEILRQQLAHEETHLTESVELLTAKKDIVASLNLIGGYQDPVDYNAAIFDGEKRLLAAALSDHAHASRIDLIAAFDPNTELTAFYLNNKVIEDIVEDTFGFISYTKGSPVYYISHESDGRFSESLTLPALMEEIDVSSISAETTLTMHASSRGVALVLTAPVKNLLPDGSEHIVGAIKAIRFLDADFAEQISHNTGSEFLYEAIDGKFISSHESNGLSNIDLPPMPRNMPALKDMHITADAVRWIPSETYFLGAAHIELSQGQNTTFVFGLPRDLLSSELRAFETAELVALFLVGLLVVPGGIIYINRAISSPIERLVEGADAIREGDYRKLSGFDTSDELSMLARSFNAMSETIRLRESDLLMFSEAVEHSPAGVILTDPDGHITYVNSKFTEMTGFQLSEILGQTPQIMNPREQDPETVKKMWRAINSGFEWRGELLNKRSNNTSFWAYVSISAIMSVDEKITHFVAIVEDISERKQADEKIRQMNQELEYRVAERTRELSKAKEEAEIANRAKSEFLANMSHELRTPLNAVIGFSDAMNKELFGPIGEPRYAEYIVNIRDSGNHLLELINDILDLSRVEAGKMELFEEDIDLAEVIDNVIKLIRMRSAKTDIMLSSEIQPDMPLLFADELRLKQILINLLTNAVKFTPEGGSIVVKAAHKSSGSIEVSITDTGTGMSAEDIVTALTSFGQATSDLARRQEGTGLGLPLTRALCEVHGGSLDIDSTPGQGTTVTIIFPPERSRPKTGR